MKRVQIHKGMIHKANRSNTYTDLVSTSNGRCALDREFVYIYVYVYVCIYISQYVIIANILEHACSKMLLFTQNKKKTTSAEAAREPEIIDF